MEQDKKVEWILRIAVFGTFIGHGILAIGVKESWIPFFTAVGISEATAITLLPIIGIMDCIVAVLALVKPLRVVLAWATIWGFATALIRPIAGHSWLDFVERSANWGAPLALLYLRGIPKKLKDWFR